MPSQIPPFLTSGASSRSHHALLVKLHEAVSDQEEREILAKEVARLKEVLAVNGQSTSKVADSLIVLLHVATVRQDTSDDLSFGLIHAVHLAESGRTAREKHIGYLYLQERLEKGHELGLMLINTIRKDLLSISASNTLLALHTIVKMPSPELSPAVTPILVSKALLKHKLPAIRQRAVQALDALHIKPEAADFPLSMSRIVKMLSAEEDESVLLTLVRTLRRLLESEIRSIGSNEEANFLAELVIDIITRNTVLQGQLTMEGIRTLHLVLRSTFGEMCEQHVLDLLDTVLPNIQVDDPAGGAILFELCLLTTALREPNVPLCSRLLRLVARGLSPRSPSSSRQIHIPDLNVHILIIRCLLVLPLEVWEGCLDEEEMSKLLDGLHSPDDTTRRATLRLLDRLHPSLAVGQFDRLLDALRTSSDLWLPLEVPTSLAAKTTAGRLETSSRALEAAEIIHRKDSNEDPTNNGRDFAQAFARIIGALNEGVVNSAATASAQGSQLPPGGQVWEEGLRRILAILNDQSLDFKEGFTTELLRHRLGSGTLAVLRCTALCDVRLGSGATGQAIEVLLEDLKDFGPSVQEIVLVALVVLADQVHNDLAPVVRAVQQVQLTGGKHMRKRCEQVIDIMQHSLLGEVMAEAKSRNIPDILTATIDIHTRWRKAQAAQQEPRITSPLSPSHSANGQPTSLRYDAYDAPSLLSASSLRQQPRYRDSPDTKHRQKGAPSITAGDLALFDADDEVEYNMRNSQASSRIPVTDTAQTTRDPFGIDEARTPTMRGSKMGESIHTRT